MTDALPELLQLLAALAAAAAVSALALAAFEAYQVIYKRYLAQLGMDAGLIAAGAPEEGPGSLAALRGTVVAFLAAEKRAWAVEQQAIFSCASVSPSIRILRSRTTTSSTRRNWPPGKRSSGLTSRCQRSRAVLIFVSRREPKPDKNCACVDADCRSAGATAVT